MKETNLEIKKVVPVETGTRFAHHIVDNIIVYTIICFPISAISNSISTGSEENTIYLWPIFITLVGGYYSIFEIIFQKTPAKFLTKTRVVDENGMKPSKLNIIIRNFGRFIPFDAISYLLFSRGIHDQISRTYVVKDN